VVHTSEVLIASLPAYLLLLLHCRMIMCPFGTSLLVGMASGGIRRLQISSQGLTGRLLKLVEVSGEHMP
jgi:hypothetical protein